MSLENAPPKKEWIIKELKLYRYHTFAMEKNGEYQKKKSYS